MLFSLFDNIKMINIESFTSFGKRALDHLYCYRHKSTIILLKFMRLLLHFGSNYLLWAHLSYFLAVSVVGYLALSVLSEPTSATTASDLFFTSVSAATVSSMSSVEMEVFSNSQLVVLTILMLLGGEVFISIIEIQIKRFKLSQHDQTHNIAHNLVHLENSIEIETFGTKPNFDIMNTRVHNSSIRYLGYVVLAYFLVVQISSSALIYCYISLISPFKTRQTLATKGISLETFSVFTAVSTFSNCGFVPANENMIVFGADSGLLSLLIPQLLLGNILYPFCLRVVIWILWKTTKRREFKYLMRNPGEIGYGHLMSGLGSAWLALTVFGSILVQITLFCAMEWGNLEAMVGMNKYQKIVASLFQVVNSRHGGESVFDLSSLSSAMLVLFVIMMFLPPYTSFLPMTKRDQKASITNGDISDERSAIWSLLDSLKLSQLSYLAIFVILICITERQQIKSDPLNFNVFNIIIEVISAYGNVGFSTGYSCKRQLKPENDCIDKWYGFVGKWSPKGKTILIVVMFFGRLKKFTTVWGKAWKTS